MTDIWIRMAGLAGAAGVSMGAIGAHAMTKSSNEMKETMKTGSLYHLIHACALGLVGVSSMAPRKKLMAGTLFTSGIVLFSGSLYTVAIMNQRKPYSYPAPIGGLCLIAGWLVLGICNNSLFSKMMSR